MCQIQMARSKLMCGFPPPPPVLNFPFSAHIPGSNWRSLNAEWLWISVACGFKQSRGRGGKALGGQIAPM